MKKIITILFLIFLTQYSIGQVIPQKITVLNSGGGSRTNKVDSATTSNDSLYYWINGSKHFGGLVGSGGSVTMSAGTGVTITGTGTSIDPYVINATGGGSGSNGGRYVVPVYGIIVDSSVANQYKISVDSATLRDIHYLKKPIYADGDTTKFNSDYTRDTLLNLAGGATGQALIKNSSTNGDWGWAAVGGSSPIDTTNKWVNNVVQQDDSTINVFKGGTVTPIHLYGGNLVGNYIDTATLFNDTTQRFHFHNGSTVDFIIPKSSGGSGSSTYIAPYDSLNFTKARLALGDTLVSFGDSYMTSTGATDANHGFINIFKNRAGVSLSNSALGGSGVVEMFKQSTSYLPAINSYKPILILDGFNDICRSGGTLKGYLKIKGGFSALLANAFLQTASPASSLTATGTWSAISGGVNYPLKATTISGTGMASTTSGDKLSYSFSGNSLVVGFIGVDSAAHGSRSADFKIVIDNTDTTFYTSNNLSSGLNSDPYFSNIYANNAIIFDNLSAGSHTAQIILTTSDSLLVDYVGTMVSPANASNVIIGSIPYSGFYPYSLVNDSIVNLASSYIKKAIRQFNGYPISYIDINSYYNKQNDASTHYHPNNIGHALIADALLYGTNFKAQKLVFAKNATHDSLIIKNYDGSVVAAIKDSVGGNPNVDSSFIQITNNGLGYLPSVTQWNPPDRKGIFLYDTLGAYSNPPVIKFRGRQNSLDYYYRIFSDAPGRTLYLGQYSSNNISWTNGVGISQNGDINTPGQGNFGSSGSFGSYVNAFQFGGTLSIFYSNAGLFTLGANRSTNPNAQLEMVSTTRGLLLPVLNTVNRLKITSAIRTGVITNGGSGYTNGTFSTQPLSGGSGTGASAQTITISGGGVTSVLIAVGGSGGYGYKIGDVLGYAIGGTGFQYTVTKLMGDTSDLLMMGDTSLHKIYYYDKGQHTQTPLLDSTRIQMGNYVASGNGSSTTITIPHGLLYITSTSVISLTAKNAASASFSYVTTDAANIYITYPFAPASGTNNLSYDVFIKP